MKRCFLLPGSRQQEAALQMCCYVKATQSVELIRTSYNEVMKRRIMCLEQKRVAIVL